MSPCRHALIDFTLRAGSLYACRVTNVAMSPSPSLALVFLSCRQCRRVARCPPSRADRIKSAAPNATKHKGREWTGKQEQQPRNETPRFAWIEASAESMRIQHRQYLARFQGLGRLGSTPPRCVQSSFFRQIRNTKTSRIREFPDARPSPSASPHNPLYSGLSPVCSGQS